jgi:hypothetical protein
MVFLKRRTNNCVGIRLEIFKKSHLLLQASCVYLPRGGSGTAQTSVSRLRIILEPAPDLDMRQVNLILAGALACGGRSSA